MSEKLLVIYAFFPSDNILDLDTKGLTKLLGTPQLINLFNEISSYVSELQTSNSSLQHVAKKRRYNDSNITQINTDEYQNGSTNEESNAVEEDAEEALLAVQDISVVIPQRKKYTIEFTKTRIRARDTKTKELVSGVGCRWADIGSWTLFTSSTFQLPPALYFNPRPKLIRANRVCLPPPRP